MKVNFKRDREMSMNRIPGDKNIYIGGLSALRSKELLQKKGITQILSAYRPSIEPNVSFLQPPNDDDEGSKNPQFKRMLVEVEDSCSENIIKHFPKCNAFIQDGLDAGGAVLVHCVMGRSRSATLIIAYLLSSNDSIDVSSALTLLTQSRPCVEPNAGFMLQLGLYFSMGCPVALEREAEYYLWLERRGGRRKSASWENIKEDIRRDVMARRRRKDEEQWLKASDMQSGVQTRGLKEAGFKDGDLKQGDLKERDVTKSDLKEADLLNTTADSKKIDSELKQPNSSN